MALTKESKKAIVEKFARFEGDTGSPEVQIAILTHEINELNEHLQTHIHDFHSKRGLFMKIGRRRNLLKYLRQQDAQRYASLISELGLRR
ncbi:MAG TPA: 30S ribosomal protein S15 [Acholeplasmataceae bacterium]|nr:30S ribosomal protein S15 [Acholeplasmataceae bacterium]